MKAPLPSFDSFFNPVLQALRELGGSASIHELNDQVTQSLNLPDESLEVIHNPETGNETEIEYRLAWARTYLKKHGLINNSERGIWSLTEKANGVQDVSPSEVTRAVRSLKKRETGLGIPETKSNPNGEIEDGETKPWQSELHRLLTETLSPAAFERLIQRLLRESGFVQVEVTGRKGDGGIDGKGIAKIHGIMSFHVIFQCKRYQGVVSAGEIRDFRGAMVGRTDKGLFITTGSFTKDAVKEATRDGAPPIDLMDGDALAEKLKELRLGVSVEMVELVKVNRSFYETI